jgi:hypothetical protein
MGNRAGQRNRTRTTWPSRFRFLGFAVSVLLQTGFCLLAYSQSWAIDLNAPAQKKVTIGSEIERGKSAIFDRTLSIYATEPLELEQAIFTVLNEEKQKNTDSDGFYLGAYYYALIEMKIAAEVNREQPGVVPEAEVSRAEHSAAFFFREFRKTQKQMNIDDRTFFKAISGGTSSGPAFDKDEAMLKEWDVKVQSIPQ